MGPVTESYGDEFAEILLAGLSSQSNERLSDDANGLEDVNKIVSMLLAATPVGEQSNDTPGAGSVAPKYCESLM